MIKSMPCSKKQAVIKYFDSANASEAQKWIEKSPD